MTLSHAWSLLVSLPLAARVAIAIASAAVPLGVWQISKAASVVLVGAAGLAGMFVHPLVRRARPKPAPSHPLVSGPIPVRAELPAWLADDVIETWLDAGMHAAEGPREWPR